MRVALVHDWLNQVGGAEDVLAALARLFPAAPIYTSIYDRASMPPEMKRWDIRASWMDRLPGIHRHHQPYLPLYPLAFAGMDVSGYDVVVSNKSGFCFGARTGDALHVCYCLTPTRYVWDFESYATAEGMSPSVRAMLWPLIPHLQRWERAAAQRVGEFVAISTVVRERIQRFYQRDSVVIFPPVQTARFQPVDTPEDYYLCLGRLIGYKRVDLAVRACTTLGRPLKVAGAGRDRGRLEQIAGPTVEFLGYVPDADVPSLLARCRAFLFPGLEDFGITPVQALAAGRPVIAYDGGGVRDTVEDGRTGVLFREQTPEALSDAILRFEKLRFDRDLLRRSAERFDTGLFDQQLTAFIAERHEVHRRSRGAGQRRELAASSTPSISSQ